MTSNKYYSPQTFNTQWSPFTEPHRGYQRKHNTNFGFTKKSTTESNGENWCETCDREFPTAEILTRHKQQHEKCNIDGCQFVAHPKVITKHIQMQHSSGLYKKIAKLHDPEEIQKWREERKKKYPTRVNIEKKAAECKEKIERGEKMALKEKTNRSKDHPAGIKRKHDFDKKNQNHKINRSNGNQRHNNSNQKEQRPPKKVPKIIPKVPSVVEKNKLIPFTGILSICMDDTVEDVCNSSNNRTSLIEDDSYEEPLEILEPIKKPIQEPVLCGALTSLMCDYGSSDEETDIREDMPVNVTGTTMCSKKIVNSNNTINKDLETMPNGNSDNEVPKLNEAKPNTEDNSDNDSGPEEVTTVKVDIIQPTLPEGLKNKPPIVNFKKATPFRNDRKHTNRYKHKVPSTLLQKLLHKEIRQERNIVLQCIRYIKKMNYFDKTTVI